MNFLVQLISRASVHWQAYARYLRTFSMKCKKMILATEKILFLGPLPPPVDGQSKATAQALLAMQKYTDNIYVVNLSRGGLSRKLGCQVKRFFELIPLFLRVVIFGFRSNIIYISISESILGNLKDIFLYMILFGKLGSVTIHMLGGSGMDRILNHGLILSKINGFFMKRMKGVIVEGARGCQIFGKYFPENRINVVPNFVEDYLFAENNLIMNKFNYHDCIHILYLSNMLIDKGYLDLLRAFSSLPHDAKSKTKLSFVGEFPESEQRSSFLRQIAEEPNAEYLGSFIDGEDKRKLYMRSHIFCLPTFYQYEGQPISILESYAMGCAVLTTHHGGIPDIFIDKYNGYGVVPKNLESIRAALLKALGDIDTLRDMALRNAHEAGIRHRSKTFRQGIVKAISSI